MCRTCIVRAVFKMQNSQMATNLVWVDLEMTGLDTINDCILEAAFIVTDNALETVAESPSLVIHQPEAVLARMDAWNQHHHARSGLLAQVRVSRISCCQVEQQALDFLQRYAVPEKSPMCGNSICQDRRFMARLMPRLERFFHYRNLDVSTLKELAQRWLPEVKICGKSTHRALDDIRDSIAELKHYREHLLKC